MADNPFLFLGNNQPQESKRARAFREDNRVINIRRSNQIISAINGNNVVNLVDQKGKGVVRSVKVVTDNPYIEMILEIDDYRVDGIYAAELMYNGDTVKSDYEVYSTNDGNPGTGYVLNYTPMGGETFEKRFRVTLRNRIPPHVIYGYTRQYVPGNGLPIPANIGFNGGSFWDNGAQSKIGNLNTSLGVVQTMVDGTDIAVPSFELDSDRFARSNTSPMYEATWPNPAVEADPGARLGIHHPYVGIAGRPTFTVKQMLFSYSNGQNMDEFHTAFFNPRTGNGTSGPQQTITFANHADRVMVGSLHNFASQEVLFIKDNSGRYYFPGRIGTTTTAGTIDAGSISFETGGTAAGVDIPTEYHGTIKAITTANSQCQGIQFIVKPGMQQKQPPIPIPHDQPTATPFLTASAQGHLCGNTTTHPGRLIQTEGNRNGAAGIVTTQAAIDPHVLLMRADVKYKLEVSYDG